MHFFVIAERQGQTVSFGGYGTQYDCQVACRSDAQLHPRHHHRRLDAVECRVDESYLVGVVGRMVSPEVEPMYAQLKLKVFVYSPVEMGPQVKSRQRIAVDARRSGMLVVIEKTFTVELQLQWRRLSRYVGDARGINTPNRGAWIAVLAKGGERKQPGEQAG